MHKRKLLVLQAIAKLKQMRLWGIHNTDNPVTPTDIVVSDLFKNRPMEAKGSAHHLFTCCNLLNLACDSLYVRLCPSFYFYLYLILLHVLFHLNKVGFSSSATVYTKLLENGLSSLSPPNNLTNN